MAYKIYRTNNYFVMVDPSGNYNEEQCENVLVTKKRENDASYTISFLRQTTPSFFQSFSGINFSDITDESGVAYASVAAWEDFYTSNTGPAYTPSVTTDQQDALDGANAPDAANVFATMADVTGATNGMYAQTVVSSTITNTTAETSIVGSGVGSLSVPADIFVVGDSFHAKIGGIISAQNGDEITINIKTGATTLATTGLISLEAVTSLGWEMEMDFTIASIGAAGDMCTNGNFAYNRNTGSLEGFVFQDVQPIDTTVSNTLDITITWNQAKTQDQIYSANFVLYKTY